MPTRPRGTLDYLLDILGVRMPTAPEVDVDPAERDAMARASQAKLPPWKQTAIRGLDTATDFARGLGFDPTGEIPEDAGMAYKAGGLAAAFPFLPKGIPGMYSRVERVAESLPKSINPNKLSSILKNRTSAEELGWRKVPEMIAGAKGDVQKEDLLNHLHSNPLDVKVIRNSDVAADAPPFYNNYQMPGASNYKEDLIQLAKPRPAPIPDERFVSGHLPDSDPNDYHSHHWDEPNVLVHTRHNERQLPPAEVGLGGMGTKNVGPKGRMIENIQSDWHQKGAHAGYQRPTDTSAGMAQNAAVDAARNALDRANQDALGAMQSMPEEFRLRTSPEWDVEELAHNINAHLRHYGNEGYRHLAPAHDRLAQARVAYDNANDAAIRASGDAVPDAPFKDNWSELALKQQLLDIAHNSPDTSWIGIAPSSELRSRGETISPKFQDEQLPRTLEKLLAPFGGQMETADLGIKSERISEPITNYDMGRFGGFQMPRFDAQTGQGLEPILSFTRRPQSTDDVMALKHQIISQQPNIQAKIARLTPEMLRALREKGFPMMAILAMLQAQDSPQGSDPSYFSPGLDTPPTP